MKVSRRNFILNGSAAMAAASISSKASALPPTPRSTKKGLGGSAPANSGLITNWYYNWSLHPATVGMPAVDPENGRAYPDINSASTPIRAQVTLLIAI